MKGRIIMAIVLFLCVSLVLLLYDGRKICVDTNKKVEGLSEELQDIFALAALAPSSHNVQSWIVDVYPADNQIEIKIDPDRKLTVVDPKDREMYISLGCYTQTLAEAFFAYGYSTECQYDANERKMVVSYEKDSDVVHETAISLIKHRHTEKAPFDKERKISGQVLESAIIKGTIDYYENGLEEYDIIKEATMTAYENQAYNQEAASELSNWLRLSNGETKKSKDGLPAEQLGIKGVKKSFYYMFTNHDSAKGENFAKQGVDNTKKQLDSANAFVIISAENNEESLIKCGQTTVDFWLQMVEKQISVHPMSYALEDEEIKAQMMKALSSTSEPQMILRIGYIKSYGENANIRRDLGDYIKVH